MSLDQMNIGEEAVVSKLNVMGSMRRRLLDIGLIEGTKVECVMKSPSGDPVAYFIRGTLIALRHDDSRNIEII